MDLRKIDFQGKLSSAASFKQYFLLMDGLMPVEWRVFVFHSQEFEKNLNFLLKHFERVVSLDSFSSLDKEAEKFYQGNAHQLYCSVSESVLGNLKRATEFPFQGVDELFIPAEELASQGQSIVALVKSVFGRMPIRRIDIVKANPDVLLDPTLERELRLECSTRGTEFFITTREDHPEQEWYSKPGEEALVDSDPLPYQEADQLFPVAANSVKYWDGFYLNLGPGKPSGKPFYKGGNAWDLLASLMTEKYRIYADFADRIQQREGNIYFNYFDWVRLYVKVRTDYNFLPSFMLRPTTRYASALIAAGAIATNPGLLKPQTQSPICLIEI